MSSARSAGDVYSYDVTTARLTRWTDGTIPGMDAGAFVEPRLIRWKSFDGREITGFHYPPPARFTGKRPVIINIHGGPEAQSRPGFLGRNNYFINELGVAMILPNVRGSTGFGKTFLKLDNGMKREDSVKDIGALLDWIAQQPDLDASRVMVTGGSYGGYMTLACAVHYADRIAGAVDVVGISNFVTFLENTESYRRDLRRVEYGDERDPAMRAFLETISPLNQRGEDHQAAVRRAGTERPARAAIPRPSRSSRAVKRQRHAGLVPHGEGRRARLREEAQRRLPVLRHGRVRTPIPAQMMIIVSSVQTQVAINCAPLANRVGVERPKVLVYRLEVEMI